MDEQQSLQVEPQEAGQRLDRFLTRRFPHHSRSYFHKLIKREYVLLNGHAVKSGYSLKNGDRIRITFHKESSNLTPADIPLDIIYEDEHLLVINKPAGMTVHPGAGTEGDTLVNALLYHFKQLSGLGGRERPGIVHRLDKFTSGLLVVAKTDAAHRHLQAQFNTKQIHRMYQALAWGKFKEPAGTVHTMIDRSHKDPTRYVVAKKGREAITHYEVIEDFEYITFLQLRLDTGRTHQIRVHMNFSHHPLVGDETYHGRDAQLRRLPPNLQKRGNHLLKIMTRQALHAKRLTFIHPASGEEMTFECPLPADMAEALQKIPQLFLLD